MDSQDVIVFTLNWTSLGHVSRLVVGKTELGHLGVTCRQSQTHLRDLLGMRMNENGCILLE